MTIRDFIEEAILNTAIGSCLLIGEDHFNSATLETLVGCRELIQQSKRPVIILSEYLKEISIEPYWLSMFFCRNSFQEESAYTQQQLDLLPSCAITKKNKTCFETLINSGALLYGIETLKTNPFILLDLIKDRDLFCKTAKKLLGFLFQDSPRLQEAFQDESHSLSDLHLMLQVRYAKSTQRIVFSNEAWTKKILQFRHHYPSALIICSLGAGHISQAKRLSSEEIVEPGMMNRLSQGGINVSACVCQGYNETEEYQPDGEGTLQFDSIPKLTAKPYLPWSLSIERP